jgi:hypothetical protein
LSNNAIDEIGEAVPNSALNHAEKALCGSTWFARAWCLYTEASATTTIGSLDLTD